MNQRDITFLTNSFPRFYGRIDSTKIDIKEMSRCIQKRGLKERNPFLAYAITDKSDQQKREDQIGFNELINRINNTLLNKGDAMAIQTIFNTLDQDKDGFIGIQDVLSVNQQLGTLLTQQRLAVIMEKLTQEGTKISKNQLAKIF